MIQNIGKLMLIVLLASGVDVAMAHGDAVPQHGGILQLVDDLEFELVAGTDTADLYIEDHDEPMPVENVTGQLTILNGTEKTKADLIPAGDNRLQASKVTIAAGARVIAIVKLPTGQSVAVRFQMP